MRVTFKPVTTGRKVLLVAGILALLSFLMPADQAQGAASDGKAKLSGEVLDHVRDAGADDLLPVIVRAERGACLSPMRDRM